MQLILAVQAGGAFKVDNGEITGGCPHQKPVLDGQILDLVDRRPSPGRFRLCLFRRFAVKAPFGASRRLRRGSRSTHHLLVKPIDQADGSDFL